MNVEVTDLEGEKRSFGDVDRVLYANQDTFALPPKMARLGDERLLVVNVNAFTTMLLKD